MGKVSNYVLGVIELSLAKEICNVAKKNFFLLKFAETTQRSIDN